MGELLVWNKRYDTQCFCQYCTGVPGWRECLDGEECPNCEAGKLGLSPAFGGWLVCTDCNFEAKGVSDDIATTDTSDQNEANN
jgi:hypothetical protein